MFGRVSRASALSQAIRCYSRSPWHDRHPLMLVKSRKTRRIREAIAFLCLKGYALWRLLQWAPMGEHLGKWENGFMRFVCHVLLFL